MDSTPQTYRLASGYMIHAPGIVRWASYHFGAMPEQMTSVIRDGWGVPEEAARALLAGTVHHAIEDDVVVFTTNAFMHCDKFANE